MESEPNNTKKIVIVSDSTGKTARRLMDAVLIQYYEKEVKFSVVKTYQNVRSEHDVDKTLAEVHDDYLVLFSIISRKLAAYLKKKLEKRDIIYLNVLRPMLDVMSKFLGVHPDYMPGKLQVVNDNYYRKIDAIGYAVRHDDGRGKAIELADVVLLGISRTCKTPVSMYLACNYGLNVANIPLVDDLYYINACLERLKTVEHDRVIGLLMQPDTLATIRESRTRLIIGDKNERGKLMDYYDIRKVTQEYRFSEGLFREHNWRVIDVTRRAIEEIAREILKTTGRD